MYILTHSEKKSTFVAELSTPVGFAEALPWFLTCSMYTTRMRDALFTIQALPAI